MSFGLNLRALKPVLHRLGHHTGTIRKGVQEARVKMLVAQARLIQDPSFMVVKEERVATRDFECRVRWKRHLCVRSRGFNDCPWV